MTGALLLALTLAHATQAPAAIDRIEVGVITVFTDGSTRTTSSAPGSPLLYFSTAGSFCEDPALTTKEPLATAVGWKVNVETIPGDARIVWRRLAPAAAARGAKNGIRVLPTAARSDWTPLDVFDVPAAPDCKISHWSLVARRTIVSAKLERPDYKLMEAELWFVHKAPAGKETTQRQAVRMRNGGRADFYFDDIIMNASVGDLTEPITVEMFGTLDTGTVMSGDQINITLKLTRRYINPKATALGVSPAVGKTDYPMTIDVGEVVSFLLPPLEGDRGAFVGHRFSLRMRLKPLGPDGN